MTGVMTLDTHVDISPANFTTERNYTTRQSTQVDLPKMEKGGLDAVFFAVYVGQDEDLTPAGFASARAAALAKFAAIHRKGSGVMSVQRTGNDAERSAPSRGDLAPARNAGGRPAKEICLPFVS